MLQTLELYVKNHKVIYQNFLSYLLVMTQLDFSSNFAKRTSNILRRILK